jgi:pectinesterase
VDEARAIGAEPVLVTSMARRTYQPDGKIRPDLGPYVEAVKKVAKEKNVPVIDLNGKSIALLEKIGPKESAAFDPTTKDGKPDHTHLSPKGSEVMARIVADDLRKVEPKLAPLITEPQKN